MFRPPKLLAFQIVPTAANIPAGRPRLLRPSRTCVVTFARIGYAIRLTTGNWRNEDLHLARYSDCRLLLISANPSLGAWAPATAVPRSAHACFFLRLIGLPPYTIEVGFPLFPVETISRRISFSGLQPFRYVQAPKFARLPDRSYRCDLSSQGSRGFYVRAEPASLPPHASDMLTTRPGNWWCGDLHPTRLPCRLLQ
jgi:hypothetical protein